MDQQLLDYVKQELKKGVPPQTVKDSLKEVGWQDQLVEEVFAAAVQPAPTVPRPATKVINYPPASPRASEFSPAKKADIKLEKSQKPESDKKINPKFLLLILGTLVLAAALFFGWKMLFGSKNIETPPAEINGNQNNPPAAETSNDPAGKAPFGTVDINGANNETATSSIPEPMVDQGIKVSAPDSKQAGIKERDERRRLDMGQLAVAQETWFKEKGKYFTCGLLGGDCGGKARAYPLEIPNLISSMPQDPSGAAKGGCGKNYVYCGLNNSSYPQYFCYYAKLEEGGYYTASNNGSAKRSIPPKIFEECGIAN